MTFTYDSSQLSSSDLMRMRLELGDTDSDRALLQDEEINQILTEESSFHLQVVACCKLIIAKLIKEPESYKIEGYTETNKQVVERYKELMRFHSAKGGGTPWVGGIDVDYKDSAALDTNLTKPFFKRGMHDYK